MVKVRGFVLVASVLVAVPGVARAAGPPGVITTETTLKIGQSGVVRMDTLDAHEKSVKIPVGVAVSRIEKGKPSDLNGKRLPASTKGLIPWYIHEIYTYANTDFSGDPATFDGLYSDGSTTDAIIGADTVGDCPHVNEFKLNKNQRTAIACEFVLAQPGVPVVAASAFFLDDAGKSFDVYWK